LSHTNGIDGHSGGRFGAATPGARTERARIDELVAMGGPRPAATRRRRSITPWRVAALIAAIIVAGGTYALGRYVVAPKPPPVVNVAVTTTGLPEGKKLTGDDYGVVTLRRSSVPTGALSPQEVANLSDRIAKFSIPRGTFLTPDLLSGATTKPDSNQALVGLALKPGQMPAGGLTVGQQVLVILIPDSAQGNPVVLRDVTIYGLLPPDTSGGEQVTILVRRDRASALANYAAHGQVSLVAVGEHS